MESLLQSVTGLSSGDPETVDRALAALADERRQSLLVALNDADSPVPLTDLARRVARRERGVDSAALRGETVDRVATQLHHAHAPKLADAGLVDARDGAFSLTDDGALVAERLAALDGRTSAD